MNTVLIECYENSRYDVNGDRVIDYPTESWQDITKKVYYGKSNKCFPHIEFESDFILKNELQPSEPPYDQEIANVLNTIWEGAILVRATIPWIEVSIKKKINSLAEASE